VGDGTERITVIADEVISVRPLNETELVALAGLARDHLTRGLPQLVLLLAGFCGVLLKQLSASDSNWQIASFIVGLGLAGHGLQWARRARRAAWLRRDRAQGKVLVLESPRGRCERLAASGLLWRRGDANAPWRTGE
jgi:hypothetical protein